MNRTARTAGIVLASASLLLSAGCARTSLSVEYSPTDGSQVDTEFVSLRNVVIVTDGEGDNALIAAATSRSDQVDALTTISSGDAPLTRGAVPLPPFGAIYFGSNDRPPVLITGTTPDAGSYVDLVFSFRRAGDIPISVLVVPNEGEYEGVIEAAKRGLVPDLEALRNAGESGAGSTDAPTTAPPATTAGGTEDETVRSES